MKFLLILIFFASQAFGQEISCDYTTEFIEYSCLLSINNPESFDGFTNISGQHLENFTDDDVNFVALLPGNSPIIPQIICQQFQNLQFLVTSFDDGLIGYDVITEHSLVHCSNLLAVSLGSPITSIHPDAIKSNTNLIVIELNLFSSEELPEDFFSENLNLNSIGLFLHNITDLPLNIFRHNELLREVVLIIPKFTTLRPEWLQNSRNLEFFALMMNTQISDLPRSMVNSRNLQIIFFEDMEIRQLDFFSFNHVDQVWIIVLAFTPLEALDFNIIDRAANLQQFRLDIGICTGGSFYWNYFNNNRDTLLARLEPCFEAFDERELNITTNSMSPIFNSIRRQKIILSIQTSSNAIVTFSSNPDGSGSNFEIHFGALSNSQTFLFVDGVMRASSSTPGVLNSRRFVDFEILWVNGLIFIKSEDEILTHQLREEFAVRFVGVRTRGARALWKIKQIKI